ncbi:hypothetical protein SEMRO_843_G209830.1 [Seminavis robusta]|uniref:Uncharacterized protein n=1 Tax=Seminavis robusta TaxID=568900 RepID=A0A9N8HKJ0_9STRA|nr:hypothetical protein SEMRO_843_G209830.1 [Seminavis robusta]|eukprot:Sro843_g209830.1 n/a (432) ;mRNA; r:41038-42793
MDYIKDVPGRLFSFRYAMINEEVETENSEGHFPPLCDTALLFLFCANQQMDSKLHQKAPSAFKILMERDTMSQVSMSMLDEDCKFRDFRYNCLRDRAPPAQKKAHYTRLALHEEKADQCLLIVDYRLAGAKGVSIEGTAPSGLKLPNGWDMYLSYDNVPGTWETNPYGDFFVTKCDEILLETCMDYTKVMLPVFPHSVLPDKESKLYQLLTNGGKYETGVLLEEDGSGYDRLREFHFPIPSPGALSLLNKEVDQYTQNKIKGLNRSIGAMAKWCVKSHNPEIEDQKMSVTIAGCIQVSKTGNRSTRTEVPHRENKTEVLKQWVGGATLKKGQLPPLLEEDPEFHPWAPHQNNTSHGRVLPRNGRGNFPMANIERMNGWFASGEVEDWSTDKEGFSHIRNYCQDSQGTKNKKKSCSQSRGRNSGRQREDNNW